MNKTLKKGYLFDLDGVLIDSESTYSEIWASIDALYPSGVDDLPTVIKGTTLNDIISNYFAADADEVRQLLHDLEGKMIYEYCDGASALLERLRSAGIPMAIVTSSDDVKMNRLFNQHPELRDIINVVVDGSMVKKSKPDPEGYLLAAHKLGIPIEDCVVIEDSVQGVKAGRSAGATVIGVIGTMTAEELEPYSHMVVHNLKELL